MTSAFKTPEGERVVRERYLKFLERWPVPNRQLRVPTREGDTFIVASGAENAPPLLLLHGAAANSAMWMGDIGSWAAHFRVYAVDLIGDAGLSAPSRPPLASEAHALWLDDVLRGLSIERASFVGISLGGWLALDYATRHPERVKSLALLCPGGVGRLKIGFLIASIPLLLLGHWGSRKLGESILGRRPGNLPAAHQTFADFLSLIHANFRPRLVRLPIFSDAALKRLTMPVLAIVGGRDVLIDSAQTRDRLARAVPHAEIRYLPEARHYIPGQTMPILDFLTSSTF